MNQSMLRPVALPAVPVEEVTDITIQSDLSEEFVREIQFDGDPKLREVIEMLEPVSFNLIRRSAAYDFFLNEWQPHIQRKKEGDSTPFDFSRISTSNITAIANEEESAKAKPADYKVVVADLLLNTANLMGVPLMYQLGQHHYFDGKRWVVFQPGQLENMIAEAGIRMKAPRMLASNADFIKSVIGQIEYKVLTGHQNMKRNMMNFLNGTLDIHPDGSVTLREHRPEDLLHYVLEYDYDPSAECTRWDAFLDEVLPEKERQEAMAEFFGSIFSDIKHEKILLLYGSGANGKSVVMEVITTLLGKKNVVHKTLEELSASHGYFRGNLDKALLNFAGEISEKVNPTVLKQLASGESMNARHVREKAFIIENFCRSAFNGNVLPRVTESTYGYFRRFLIIPFDITIPENRWDRELHKKICAKDLPGIVNWMISGLQRLLASGGAFTPSEGSMRILRHYQESTMNVSLFVKEYAQENQGEFPSSVLYAAYTAFCERNEYIPVNTKDFSSQLQAAKCIRTRKRSGVTYRLPTVQATV